MITRVQQIIDRHNELETLLSSTEVAANPKKLEEFGREYGAIGKMLPALREYLSVFQRLQEAHSILKTESDQELLTIAHDEIESLEPQFPALEEKVKLLLTPKNPDDYKNVIFEIRAGTGGVEAGLFGAVLYRMYSAYIERKGWKIEVMSLSPGDLGGIKEIIFMVSGEHVYGTLKFESGVHRVQRVPQTETQGRIHTSAASVVVLPEADEVEVTINPNELRIDVFRSSGPGGQSVNTTDSAVRIVHVPTGLTVTCQDEKSQHKNKAKALKVLQSRLYDIKRAEREAQDSASRRSMISTGDRSAKIRTYNFPQGRVTDHRINLTLYKLAAVVDGDLDDLVEALAIADLNERIQADSANLNHA
jgi:peptide chain release factor 1